MGIGFNDDVAVNKKELKERLILVIRKHPASQVKIASFIGINPITFMKFYRDPDSVSFRVICMIEDWVILKEKLNE